MARIIISYVIPLLLPTVMYLIWAAWVRTKIAANRQNASNDVTQIGSVTPSEVEPYEIRTPWFRLIFSGVILVLIMLLLGVFLSPKNPPESTYQVPRIVDGKIVPGEFVVPE